MVSRAVGNVANVKVLPVSIFNANAVFLFIFNSVEGLSRSPRNSGEKPWKELKFRCDVT